MNSLIVPETLIEVIGGGMVASMVVGWMVRGIVEKFRSRGKSCADTGMVDRYRRAA